MINYKKYFDNKKITKQGFGILGRSLGVVKFLLKNNAELLVTDMKDESFFTDQILEIENFMKENNISKDKIKYVFGKHEKDDFLNCDYVIQASGVPKDNIYLKYSRENSIPVYQESSLFLKIVQDFNENLDEESKIKVVTVTGTRGKTTTTQLIYKILKDNLKDRNVYLGGNIQGISTIELLENVKEKDIIVMETDSWLAQGFKDIKFAPKVSIFTNLMRDHMNYYKDNMSDYFSDKAQTFLYQNQNDVLISDNNFQDCIEKYLNEEFKDIYKNSNSKKVFLSEDDIRNDEEIYKSLLIGIHNRLNISFSVRTAKEFNITDENIQKSVLEFNGVDGRLQFVKEENGMKYYNDTTATTGEATIAAINALKLQNSKNGKLILITGGTDKELEIENYTEKLISEKRSEFIKEIIFLLDDSTTGTKKVLEKMKESNFEEYKLAETLEKAVSLAKELSSDGDVILFSPGFASFGMFLNEYDRGEKFLKLI
ncbi:MAG: UDP-N-acetylmuramoyl-L-alanine--D-glutamate ligase [Candidatus Nomurabacteria bacterium]